MGEALVFVGERRAKPEAARLTIGKPLGQFLTPL